MFKNSFFGSKNKDKSKSKKSKDKNEHINRVDSNTYEEVKLNKAQLGSNGEDGDSQNESDLMSDFVVVDYKEFEPYTLEEWEAILGKTGLLEVDQKRLYVSLHKGIPKELRKRIWLFLANVDEIKKENANHGISYQSLLSQKCPHSHNITKDINRTFPDHEFFVQNRKDRLKHLENVLIAYANFDQEVGYTQGMNFLVGTLIYYMHLERTEKEYYVIDRDFEADVFWILVHIMQKKGWRYLYIDDTPKLVELLNKLELRISKELPKLYTIFQEYSLIPACFSQCFLTLLFYNSPLRFAKRVLDMFLLVGEDIILDLVLKMLSLCQNDILAKQEVEELYPFLRSQLVEYTFKKYEKEFEHLVAGQNVIRIIEYN